MSVASTHYSDYSKTGCIRVDMSDDTMTDNAAANEAIDDETTDIEPGDTVLDDSAAESPTVVSEDEAFAPNDDADSDDSDGPVTSFDLTSSKDSEEEEVPVVDAPWLRPGKWYVVHTQSGYEKKVQVNLGARIQSMNMEERIFEIVIPMEEVVEFKNGRKQIVQKKVFPGYLLVRCEMDDESWYCIRNTPGVTGFVGQARFDKKPTPLSRREVDTFLTAKGDGQEATPRRKPKLEYDVGEGVRVKEGPFADFNGTVAEINADHMKLKVLVNIFGRDTLVEMDFAQVAKL